MVSSPTGWSILCMANENDGDEMLPSIPNRKIKMKHLTNSIPYAAQLYMCTGDRME